MLIDPVWNLEARPPLYGQKYAKTVRRRIARWGTKRRIGATPVPSWMPLIGRVETGLYESIAFDVDHLLPDEWDSFGPMNPLPGESFRDFYERATSVTRYGVCDSIEQFKETPLFAQLAGAAESYAVTFVFVRKDVQPKQGGWRWHRWGPYIGNHVPEYEYLADEEAIDSIMCFRVHEKVL